MKHGYYSRVYSAGLTKNLGFISLQILSIFSILHFEKIYI